MISDINSFKLLLPRYVNTFIHNKLLLFCSMNIISIINKDKNFIIKLKINIINYLLLSKTIYNKFKSIQFLILVTLYQYLCITKWILTYAHKNHIISKRLITQLWYKDFFDVKKFNLFPFNYLAVNNILFFNKYDYLHNKKKLLKKYCIFLYLITSEHNIYTILLITVDTRHIFLNNVLVNKFSKINRQKNSLTKRKNTININKFSGILQCPFFNYYSEKIKKIVYGRSVLLLSDVWDNSNKSILIKEIGIKMKNAILFFNLLKFLSKHLPKSYTLNFIINFNNIISQNFLALNKNQTIFFFFSLIDDTVGIILKNYYFYVRILIFKQYYLVKSLLEISSKAINKNIIFIKSRIYDCLSFKCKLKNKYILLHHGNNICLTHLILYLRNFTIFKRKSKIFIIDKDSILLVQNYKMKPRSESFKNLKCLY
ncbi:hypothetical protein M951_chr1141 (nucleomorph) [Lotharella oceanica]|uniref:Uncharacterized protein n=1 Tax=Lotharella oceanica TaxID=641309 RepID=A0A060D6L3_9EUKA|nr:hypothetical protein M951_chr1141 [Lotharella oceanica]|mmetsp:Transcript_4854/g.9647  ORF Transcript_4854/g.9647 Transcript_4854/m.9647 type:complete len:428 (+) Transcript_4854:41-1324(+)